MIQISLKDRMLAEAYRAEVLHWEAREAIGRSSIGDYAKIMELEVQKRAQKSISGNLGHIIRLQEKGSVAGLIEKHPLIAPHVPKGYVNHDTGGIFVNGYFKETPVDIPFEDFVQAWFESCSKRENYNTRHAASALKDGFATEALDKFAEGAAEAMVLDTYDRIWAEHKAGSLSIETLLNPENIITEPVGDDDAAQTLETINAATAQTAACATNLLR